MWKERRLLCFWCSQGEDGLRQDWNIDEISWAEARLCFPSGLDQTSRNTAPPAVTLAIFVKRFSSNFSAASRSQICENMSSAQEGWNNKDAQKRKRKFMLVMPKGTKHPHPPPILLCQCFTFAHFLEKQFSCVRMMLNHSLCGTLTEDNNGQHENSPQSQARTSVSAPAPLWLAAVSLTS